MDEKKFKKDNKPAACTMPPWAGLIPKAQRDDVLRQIRHETVEHYGYSMDECPKRLVCLGKTCLGRPLPHKSPTAKPYIDQLRQTHTFNNDELMLSNCDICPIRLSCTSTCSEMNDFMNRDRIKEPYLDFRENLENVVQEPERSVTIENLVEKGRKVPWDALTTKRKETVEKYLYEQKDFLTIARELGYHDQSRARYELYAALTTLAEYATMRKFYEDNESILKEADKKVIKNIYLDNLSITSYSNVRS